MKVFLYIFLLWSISSFSQELILPMYKQYGVKDGLPQSQVTALFEDSRGYIWIGTKDGVARFNGETFTSFTAKNNFPFKHTDKIEIVEDKNGDILVLTTGGIARISGNEVTSYIIPKDYFIEIFDTDFTEKLYFTARKYTDDSLYLGYFFNGKFHIEQLPFDVYGFLKYSPKEKKFYVIHRDGIFSYDSNTKQYQRNDFPKTELTLVEIQKIDDDLIVFTKKFDTDFYQIYKIVSGKTQLIGEHQNGVWETPLPESVKHKITAFSFGTKYNLEKGEVIYTHLENQYITSRLVDKNGIEWLGSERGLIRMHSEAFANYNSQLLPEVWSVVESPKGKFWFGSFSFGLKSLENNKLSVENLQDFSNIYKIDYYFHPVEGKNGVLYFPINNGILKRSSNGKTKLLEYHWDQSATSLYTFYDKQRNLLLGGFYRNVAVWNEKDELIRVIGREKNNEITGFVLSITKDSVGNYWFGGAKLSKYNWETQSFKQYESRACIDIAVDSRGQVWFGTSKGLYFYDSKTDSVQKLNIPELQEVVSALIVIDEKRLLVSQPNGLYVLDLYEYHTKGNVCLSLYNETNGYLGQETGQTGMYKDSEGKIWITGLTLSRLDPSLLPPYKRPQFNVVFNKFNNTNITYAQKNITLPTDEHSVTIVFDAVVMNRVSPILYSYRFDNEQQWSDPQTENYLTLTDLPHGKTTLQLKAWFEGMSDSKQNFTLDIQVTKAFYNRAWFIPAVIFALLITIIIVWYIQIRTKTRLEKTIMRAKISEVETIQSQMNPHFVYNVLVNVQTKIRSLQMNEAENTLLNMAHLIRRFLHTSTDTTIENKENLQIQKHLVSLSYELHLLQEFINFQETLYPDIFDYGLIISNEVDLEKTFIPPMLLQPFVENAISHGLIPKKQNGTLQIIITKEAEKIQIQIVDNGIGMEQSRLLQQQSKLRYPSRGRKLTLQRIELLNELGIKIAVNTTTSQNGTTIMLIFG